MLNVQTEEFNSQNIKKIMPNFIMNRFDLVDLKNCFVFHCISDTEDFYVPAHKKGKTIFLGLYLKKISAANIKSLMAEIFQKMKNIERIKIFSSLNNLNNFNEHIDYITVLPESQEAYMSELSSQTRYNIKRKIKNFQKNFGEINIKEYEEKEIPDKLFHEYFKLKHKTHGTNYLFMTPEKYKKQYHVTKAYELLIRNETKAVVLISEVEGNVYLENLTYDTAFSKYSLGIILSYYMLSDLIKRHKNCVYWGLDGEYKKHFANQAVTTYSGCVYKNSKSQNLRKFLKFLASTKTENGKKYLYLAGIKIRLF